MIKLEKYQNEDDLLLDIKRLFFRIDASNKTVINKFKSRDLVIQIEELMKNELKIDNNIFINKKETLIESLIVADYKDLEAIKRVIDEYIYDKGYSPFDLPKYEKVCEDYKKLYEKLIDRKINIKLSSSLNIKVCPYCNENYIIVRGNNASFQMDHFFPKSIYPIFTVSLYNLIPSCYACNHNKRDQLINISPFNHDFDFDKIKISYIPKNSNFYMDEKNFDILIHSHSSSVNKDLVVNKKVLGLDKTYDYHKDYMLELLKKSILYDNVAIHNLMQSFPKLFNSYDEVLQVIYANYPNREDMNKRPLSKMTVDFLEELGYK